MRALFLVLMALSLISVNVNQLRDGNNCPGLLQFLRCLPPPPPPLRLRARLRSVTGSVHRAFQFWLRLVLLVLAAVLSCINLSSPWWPLFVTLVAASCTVLSLLLM